MRHSYRFYNAVIDRVHAAGSVGDGPFTAPANLTTYDAHATDPNVGFAVKQKKPPRRLVNDENMEIVSAMAGEFCVLRVDQKGDIQLFVPAEATVYAECLDEGGGATATQAQIDLLNNRVAALEATLEALAQGGTLRIKTGARGAV